MTRRAHEDIPVAASSGNVFADLGLPDAVDLDVKVRLAVRINRLLAAQRLSPLTAAALLEMSGPKLVALKNYRLEGYSAEVLIRSVLALEQKVERQSQASLWHLVDIYK